MLAKNDLARIYETVLSIPGMNENVKLSLQLPRKNVLLLSKVIERGLAMKEGEDKSSTILDIVSPATLQELTALAGEILQKAGLTDMNEKLKSF
jgi:hypothetical protein